MKTAVGSVALAFLIVGCGDETGPGSGFGGASGATTGTAGAGGAAGGSTSSAGGGTGQGGGGPSSFSCGPLIKCNTPTHYCEEFHPGVQGADIVYECKELPAACGIDPSCACLTSGGCMCGGTGDTGLTVTCFGA